MARESVTFSYHIDGMGEYLKQWCALHTNEIEGRRYDVDTYDLRSSSNYLAPMGTLMHGVEHQCARESSVAKHECARARVDNRTNLLGP